MWRAKVKKKEQFLEGSGSWIHNNFCTLTTPRIRLGKFRMIPNPH